MQRRQIYFASIVKRWKLELSLADDLIYILSPYVTSKTAELVISATYPSNISLFTVFSVENFVNGASSASTLMKLSDMGVKLFHLENLHAKVIIIPKKFVSIGSQNLTTGGNRNLEATFGSNDEKVVADATNQIKGWLKNASPIESEDLSIALKSIKKLKKERRQLQNKVNEIEALVLEEKIKREEIKKLQFLREKRLKNLAGNSKKLTKVSHTEFGYVNVVNSGWGILKTFQPTRNSANFLQWEVVGYEKPIKLKKTFRYPCIVINTGKIGWVRLGKSRITFVGNGIAHQKPIDINGKKYSVYFKANRDLETIPITNLSIELQTMNNRLGTKYALPCFFDLKGLLFDKLPEAEHVEYLQLVKWIKENPSSFKSIIHKILLKPFLYHNKLAGSQADALFEGRKRYSLRLAVLEGQALLVAKIT